MEINLGPELEARINEIASNSGREKDEVIREAVTNYLEHDDWFRKEVQKGLDSLDRGEVISDEEVRRIIFGKFDSK